MPNKYPYQMDEVSRRTMLEALGVGAAGALAGCNEPESTATDTPTTNGDGVPSPTTARSDLAHVEGQTFRMPITINPEEYTFFDTGPFPRVMFKNIPWEICHELGMWGQWSNRGVHGGEIRLGQYSNVDLSSDEMTIEIRDDATWSDGEPVKARDFLGVIMAFRLFFNVKPFEQTKEEGPSLPTDSITDIEINEKSWTWIGEGGTFDQVIDTHIYEKIGAAVNGWGPQPRPTHITPYDDWFNRIEDAFRQAVEGELHPWVGEPADPGIREIANGNNQIKGDSTEHQDNVQNEWFEKFRQPENVVTNGPFKPKAIRGNKEIVLERNPEYYDADKINFDEVVLELRDEERARWAALRSDTIDLNTDRTPPNVVDSLPDNITARQGKANTGISLALNHGMPQVEDRKARHAIYYALDKERIAQTVHPRAESPVRIPGGNQWGMENLVSKQFIDNNLRSFEQDTEKAEALLREAGWSLDGGSWSLPNGEKAKITVPTTDETPQMEVAVSNQLNNFGIESTVQTMNPAKFQENRDAGDLAAWPSNRGVGWYASVAEMYQGAVVLGLWAKMFGWFPEEQINETTYGGEKGGNGLISPATTEGFAAYTLEAPEIGDWGGSLKEWHPPKLSWQAWRPESHEQYQDAMKGLAWLYNWHLPMLPLTNSRRQMFMDSSHWIWPNDEEAWSLAGIQNTMPHHFLGQGMVSANPDNPEDGASVQD